MRRRTEKLGSVVLSVVIGDRVRFFIRL